MEVPTGAADHGISKLEGNVWPARPSRSDAWSDAWGMQPRPPALASASRLGALVPGLPALPAPGSRGQLRGSESLSLC